MFSGGTFTPPPTELFSSHLIYDFKTGKGKGFFTPQLAVCCPVSSAITIRAFIFRTQSGPTS